MRSKTFTLTRPYVHYLAAGKGGRINVVIDGFEKIRAPIYGDLVHDINHEAFRWNTMDLAQWVGHQAYIEIDDGATVDFTGSPSVLRDGRGYIAVDEIRFADGPAPTLPARSAPDSFGADEKLKELQPLLARYREIEATLPEPTLGQALNDGTGLDARKSTSEATPGPSARSPLDGSWRCSKARRPPRRPKGAAGSSWPARSPTRATRSPPG